MTPTSIHSGDLDPTSILSGELHVQALDEYSKLLGLVSPSFLYGPSLAQDNVGPLHADANSRIVQIHFIPGHYVVSCEDEGQITIYDSVPYEERSVQLLPQL